MVYSFHSTLSTINKKYSSIHIHQHLSHDIKITVVIDGATFASLHCWHCYTCNINIPYTNHIIYIVQCVCVPYTTHTDILKLYTQALNSYTGARPTQEQDYYGRFTCNRQI